MDFNFKPKHVQTPNEYIAALKEGYYDVRLTQDNKEVLFEALKAHRNEHPAIMHAFAKKLLSGSGEEKKQAFTLLVELARQKYAPAMNTLAVCYLRGRGVDSSVPRFRKCLERAMELDFPPAFFNVYLSSRIFFDESITKREKTKLKYEHLKKADQSGFYPARIEILRQMVALGFFDHFKIELEEHLPEYSFTDLCDQLIQEPENQGEIQYLLGLYAWSQRPSRYIPVEENLAFEKAAFECQVKAAENGFHIANMELAAHYYSGKGVERSLEQAVSLWQNSAEYCFKKRLRIARYNTAICYETGTVLPQSYENAVALYEKESPFPYAASNLAVCYLLGRGTQANAEKAIELLKDAIEGVSEDELSGSDPEDGYPFYNLAQCYENGYGVSRSWPKALALYKKAALIPTPEAIYRLAAYYELGINVTQSHRKAERLLNQLKNNDPDLNIFDASKYEKAKEDVAKSTTGVHISPLSRTMLLQTEPAESISNYRGITYGNLYY